VYGQPLAVKNFDNKTLQIAALRLLKLEQFVENISVATPEFAHVQ
jgi:hypothetical protein